MTWKKYNPQKATTQRAAGEVVAATRRAWRRMAAAVAGLGLLAGLSGCGIYSFGGTNIDPAIRTFSVQTIQSSAPTAPPFLTQRFTEDMKDYFQRNTNLKLVPRDGDLQFEGTIVAYDYSPTAIQKVNGVDQAGSNRLTIQVQIRFTNTRDDKQSFDRTFQNQGDFQATQDIASVNNDQTSVRRITTNIITDIFNSSVANW